MQKFVFTNKRFCLKKKLLRLLFELLNESKRGSAKQK